MSMKLLGLDGNFIGNGHRNVHVVVLFYDGTVLFLLTSITFLRRFGSVVSAAHDVEPFTGYVQKLTGVGSALPSGTSA
jgi:predicted Co/Zn/Cd cation transporter (cation efflux family)